MKKWLLGILLFCTSVQAASFEVPEYKGYVTDNAELFNDHVEAQLVAQIEAIEEETTAEIAVLTVLTTDGISISQYATEVGHEWGVGKEDVDNGLMIVIAVADRQWYMASGYGLEGILPDLRLKRIGERHFPENFRTRNYFIGVSDALLDIEGFLKQDESIISKYPENEINWEELTLPWYWLIIIHALVLWLLYMGWKAVKKSSLKVWAQTFFFAIIGLSVIFSAGLFFYLIFAFFFGLAGFGEKGSSSGYHGWSSGGSWSSGGGGFGGFGGGGFGGGGAGGSW